MTLAKELLEQGHREVVLQYLESCRSFWESGESQLDEWSAIISRGEMPDFGRAARD